MASIIAATLLGAASLSTRAPDVSEGESGDVSSIVDGDTLFLASGLKVRLSGIQAPKLSLGREHVKDWPLGYESKAALIALTKKRAVRLYYDGARRDRYDRALAQVFTLDKSGNADLWVQEEMLRRGLARVYTWPDTRQDSARLYRAEISARDAKLGMWALDDYAIRKPDPDPLAQDVDSFQLVEGVITSAANVRDMVYLNFGANYKTDFTVVIDKDAAKLFAAQKLDPMSLEGARVRVRGWIELKNGPMIWLEDPDRLEILE